MTPTAPPEYCLFWIDHWSMCMQKGEWSGWIQAVGSIAAVLGAYVVATVISRQEQRSQRKQALDGAVAFAIALVPALIGIRKGLDTIEHLGATAMKHNLRTAAELGMGLRLDLLPITLLPLAMGLRSLAAEAAETLVDLETERTIGANLAGYMNELVRVATDHRNKLIEAQTAQTAQSR